ncbi:MAG: lipopolysaccharide heptosyltransferase II [Vicinamibacterales bacterium]
MSTPDAVIIVAPNWLGDAVMALPAIADLRRHFSAARLIVAARPGVTDLFQLVPGVDEIVPLSWRGEMLRTAAFRADAERLQQSGASLAVLFPNSFASAWLARRARVEERWGYGSDVRTRLLTRAVRRPKGSRHQGEYYQHLTRELGVAAGPLTPELRVSDESRESARALLSGRGWDTRSPLVTLAPGAAYGKAKQWLPGHVVQLATRLAREGTTCVLVGSKADAETTHRIRTAMPPDAAARTLDLAGVTSLGELAGVLALSRACVSNDSGAMHVAAALGTPVVALFGPTIEAETRPLIASGGWSRVLTSPVWCRPCMLRECPLDHRCMTRITPDMVASALAEVPSSQMQHGATQ